MTKWQGLIAHQRVRDLLSLLSGAIIPFAFAPYNLSYLVFPVIAAYLWLNQNLTNKKAFWRGWLFGFGQFMAGIYWVYYSIHVYGHAPLVLTLLLVVLLAGYCALFPALALYLSQRFRSENLPLQYLLVIPLMWGLTEWLRGYLFTGFPWLQMGVSQVDSPLAGIAPVLGGLGIGVIVFVAAGLLLLLLLDKARTKIWITGVAIIFISGWLLNQLDWTEPAAGSVSVSIPQLSIEQSQKWRADKKQFSINWYLQQSREHSESDIIIWPETAIPSFLSRVKSYWNIVTKEAEKNNTDILAGVFIRNPETGRYYNSLVGTNGDYYQKRHLVPLGEYFPLRDLLSIIDQMIRIPMNDIANGPDEQVLMKAAGQPVGVSICFEDVFDREIRKSLPEATLLVNVSNDAWFHQSVEPFQHHQIARMRAMESSRYMLRSTNTGVSAIIDHKGNTLIKSGMYDRTTITGEAIPMKGSTPYVLWGNVPVVLLALVVLGWRVYEYRKKV